MAPSLGAGFNLDDHLVRASARPAWDRFRVGDHGINGLAAWIDAGLLPWWTPPQGGLSSFRPVTSLTVAVEQALWPDTPWLVHAANLLLFMALVLATAALYRRIHQGQPAWVAGLATLLFALDDAHGMPVGWWSGRHLILGALFGVLALTAHDRWRRDGWVHGAWAGPALAALATASSEVGGCVAAYMFAYAVVLDADRAPRIRRLLAVAPSLAVVAVVRGASIAAGYGLWGTRIGYDPWRQPWAFVTALPDRLAALTFGQWGWVPSDLWVLVPPGEGRGALIVAGIAFVALMAWAMYPVFARSPVARFWAAGAALTMVAVCDVFPQDRLLVMAGVGAFGVIGQFIASFVDHPEWWRPGFWSRGRARFLAWSWVVIHVGLAALLLVPRSVTAQLLGSAFDRLADDVHGEFRGRDLAVIRAPDAWSAGATPAVLASRGQEGPRRVIVLYAGAGELVVTGTADGMVLEPADGFFADTLAQAYLGEAPPRAATVGPVAIHYTPGRADVALSGPVELMVWTAAGYEAFTPPRPGARTVLPAVSLEAAFAPSENGSP